MRNRCGIFLASFQCSHFHNSYAFVLSQIKYLSNAIQVVILSCAPLLQVIVSYAGRPASPISQFRYGSSAVLTAEKIQQLKFHCESPRLNHRQAIPLSRVARRQIPSTHLPDLFNTFGCKAQGATAVFPIDAIEYPHQLLRAHIDSTA